MNLQSSDPFEIDMDLLRRVGAIRTSLQTFQAGDPDTASPVLEALRGARARAGRTGSLADRLLAVMEQILERVASDPTTAPSHLPTALDAVMPALDEMVLAPWEAASLQLLDNAALSLMAAAGLDPAEWAPAAIASGADSAPATTATSRTDVAASIDDVAAFLVEMDAETKDQVAELATKVGLALQQAEGRVAELLEEAADVLTPLTEAKRSRKAARRDAVAAVALLVEDAAILLEEMETDADGAGDEAGLQRSGQPVPDPASPRAPSPPEPPPVASTNAPATRPPAPEAVAEAVVSAGRESIPAADPFPAGADNELMGDFVTESFEYLEQAEEALLALENNPTDPEAVNVVFRAFHTIKGVSGFLELRRISEMAHHAESLLSRVRDGALVFTAPVADLSLRGLDVLKSLLSAVRTGMETGSIAVPQTYAPLFDILADPALPDRIRADEVATPSAPLKAREATAGPEASDRETSPGGENSVRIRTERLDRLVDMVGELVIAHSMLAQDPVVLADRRGLSRKVDHTAKILRELQDLSTSLRMVPLKPALRKVSRVVRDLSRKSGKQVRLVTEGEDTEIDRSMVDVLADPLVHMVRNSVDHGLESAAERTAAGKPPEGVIRISAFQAEGNVVIQISDDGRGLNRERILTKAKERGIIESDRGLSDREIYDLIFAAGFSTAEKVTEVSGRGVGMDVVRRNVESLRGRVTIDSTPGQGSTFRINVPLTLAITDGMVISIGAQRYIIPSVKILMSLRPEPSALSKVAGKGEMVLFHGELLPIVRLHRLWEIPEAVEDPTQGLLVIVGEGRRKAALLVDELVTQQQFVVKPLGGIVSNTKGVAGGAVLGNGDVGLILDPDAILAMYLTPPSVVAA